MISLKRYLDASTDALVTSILDSYRANISAASEFGAQVCPHVAPQFQQSLLGLEKQLGSKVTPEQVAANQQKVAAQFKQWAGKTSDYLKEKASEVKELMMVLANTAESVGERDHRYASQFAGFSAQLLDIADLEDITRIKASVLESAQQLKTYVDKMAEESRRAVELMRGEVASYQAKLEETERAATRDAVTGLDNRRSAESEIHRRIQQGMSFSVLMFDLNNFKQVNDKLGHLAGDDLLRQFSKELKSVFRPLDTVGRWGGDEFIVVLDCTLDKAQARLDQVRNWVFGDYSLKANGASYKVPVSAAIGAAQWSKGQTLERLIEAADAAMYQDKRRRR